MPRSKKKGSKKSYKKRSYSKKKTAFKRKFAKRRSYSKKRSLSVNPFKANAALIKRQYSHYMSHVESSFQVPNGVTMTASNLIQAMQYRYYRLDTYNTLDIEINKFTSLYQYYRLKHVWIEIKPKWNMITDQAGNQMGEVLIVPLHRPEEIYRSGQSNVGFGGTFSGAFPQNWEQWLMVPGAKKFSFNKPGSLARMKIPLTSFDYQIENPDIAGFTSVFSGEIRPRKATWLPVMSSGATTIPALSSIRHYGFAVFFYGWDTTIANAQFNFNMRQFLELEFKTLNIWPQAGIGSEVPLHVEEPWEEEEDAKSQSSVQSVRPTPTLKRGFTNMNLASPTPHTGRPNNKM
jgi:hypothetical protein